MAEWVEFWPGDCALIMTGEEMLYRCSECDAKYADVEGYRFCPHCGKAMDLEVSTMTKMHAITTAAKWWADKLKQRSPHSNGDNSPASVLACSFTDMLAEEITDDQLALFTERLGWELLQFMEKHNEHHVFLSSDYGPKGMLREAAVKAGICQFNFPYKTHMRIGRDGDSYTVEVKDGYGRGYEKIAPCELPEEADNG